MSATPEYTQSTASALAGVCGQVSYYTSVVPVEVDASTVHTRSLELLPAAP